MACIIVVLAISFKEVAFIYQTVANVLKVSISIRTNNQNLLSLE